MSVRVHENILIYAFRYALGRETSSVAALVEELIENWNKLSFQTKTVIKKEIKEAIDNNKAGARMDIEEWKKILLLKIEN